MNAIDLSCWKCGASLADALLPLSRLSKCKSCNADLHVCRLCQFFDTTVNNSCREPIAEKVTDKQKKNFCGYFQPSTSSFNTADVSKQTAAKDQLDALFGIMTEEESAKSADRKLTPEEESKKKLEDLFKSDNNF
ncbi:MAG: hypothetical protein ACKVHQ_08000 [Gammaproteobacteria bacterium]|jgi:hypothetical protein